MKIEVPYIDNDWLLEYILGSTEPPKVIKTSYIKEKNFTAACLANEVRLIEIEKLHNFLRKKSIDCVYMSTIHPPEKQTFHLNVDSEKFVDDFYEIYSDIHVKWLGWLLFNDQRDILMFTDSDYYHVWIGSKEFVRHILSETIRLENLSQEFQKYMIRNHLDESPLFNYLLENYT